MIVVVDTGVGNLGSIANMFKKIGSEGVLSSEIAVIEEADKLVLPGVGSFDSVMENVKKRNLIGILTKKVLEEKTPILGICLGMQLFTQRSEEGHLPGLGWLNARTVRFKFEKSNVALKIPHMGWNTIEKDRDHPLWSGMNDETRFYFVHSHHVICDDESLMIAHSQYGYPFASAIARENIMGVQFHPEKSHKFGMSLFHNFVRLT